MLHSCTTIKRQESGVLTQPHFSPKQRFYTSHEIRSILVVAFKDRQIPFSHRPQEERQKKIIRAFVKTLTFLKGL